MKRNREKDELVSLKKKTKADLNVFSKSHANML
jgi:hypothetical protein